MKITEMEYPMITAARAAIERDGGGHLIGTVYPGQPVNMSEFDVPDERYSAEDVMQIEMALTYLRMLPPDMNAIETFCIGEQTEQDAIIAEHQDLCKNSPARGDLRLAHKFLDDYFNGWSDE